MIKPCPRCADTNYRAVKKGSNYCLYCKTCGKFISRTTIKEMRSNNIDFIRPISKDYLELMSNQAINRMTFFDKMSREKNPRADIAYSYYKGRRDICEHLIRYMEGENE